MGLTSLSH
eukprot:symbB.v1.2.043920.t1/scaffold20622.1/size544/1